MKKLLLFLTIVFIFGSFTFAQKRKASVKKPTALATLSFETGVDFQFGGVQKVSRGTFLLLNEDWKIILEPDQDNLAKYFVRMEQISQIQKLAGQKETAFTNIFEKTSQYLVSKTMSNFDGVGEFKNIKPGKYWIANMSQMRGNMVVWNVPVVIKSGKHSIILDQNNAEFAD